MWGRLVLCWAQASGFAARCQFLHAPRCRRSLAALAIILTLGGCSASKVIDIYAADYRDTTASAGDAQLLLNILRAKDNLPIHFSDLSIIHGSIQWTAGGSTIVPWAHFLNSATPSQSMGVLGTQTAPTFDLGTLDTQDFTKGILQPIDPNIVKALFDQGVDPRVMLLLFFSEYQGHGKQYLNSMACDLTYPIDERGCRNRVYDYYSEIDHIVATKGRPPLRANTYVVLTPVGGKLSGDWSLKDNLGDLSGLDPKMYTLKDRQLYAISGPKLAICYERNHQLHSLFSTLDKFCTSNEIIMPPEPGTHGTSLSVRSVYDIIEYLGQVLRFQEEKGNDRCVTLDLSRTCDSGEVLFQVNAPVGAPVVATNYANRRYAIYARECMKNFNQPCDHSLEVLAILELLLNANKAAKDIPSTPRVQVVP
jgi:hypothetical protein